MAEKTVRIEGTVPVLPQGTTAVSGFVTAASVKDPLITGVYAYSAAPLAGVVAANNYITLVNPTGSGKSIALFSSSVSCTTAGATTVTAPMRAFRASAVSGGSLQAASTIAEFMNSYPASIAEIRLGNPTATVESAIFSSPPAISATVGTTSVHLINIPPGAGSFLLAPGEGVVFRTTIGDVDLQWNIGISWAEM